MEKDRKPALSVVITVLNEAENILPVCKEISKALSALPSFEVLIVDDGSTDQTLEQLFKARSLFLPQLRILVHPHCLGKSAALRTAISHAKAFWIATMDGDGQDNPSEIPKLFSIAVEKFQNDQIPIVVGVRRKRQDRFSRRLATRFANYLRQRLLNDHCPDTGAPLKIFLRDKFLELPQFEGLHRFLPALMKSYGVTLYCQEITHRPRLHGHSKYTNFNRALVGIRDLLGVKWLQKRTHYVGSVPEL